VAVGLIWSLFFSGPDGSPVAARSVAALPFQNLSPNPEETEWIVAGIYEEVYAQLALIPDLTVKGRRSAEAVASQGEQSLREIADALGVTTILEASVTVLGDRIRLNAELRDAVADSSLWTERFERDTTDILRLQSDIALQIATAFQLELSGDQIAQMQKEPTTNQQAYNLYIRGRHQLARLGVGDLQRAIDYFNRAVEEDPRFALAQVGLAEASLLLAELEHYSPAELARVTREPALRALEIDSTLAEAHAIVAYVRWWYDFDWLAADSTFRIALELNPNAASSYVWYCQFLGSMRRTEEAIAACERGAELDPLDPFVAANLASAYLFYARRPEAAYTQLLGALELWPDHWVTHILLGFYYYFYGGQPDQGIEEFERSVELGGRDRSMLAFAYAREGREADAREILRELEERSAQEYVSGFELAVIYAGLGERDKAFEMLQIAYEERFYQMMRSLNWNPVFDDLRTDPRFTALLEKMGLPN
jgi:TolB-like protein/Flp pilus assembly protein TadD